MAKKYAPTVYDALNGVFCIYKPEGRSFRQVVRAIQEKLTQGKSPIRIYYYGGYVIFAQASGGHVTFYVT